MESDWQHAFECPVQRNMYLLRASKLVDCNFLVGDSPPNKKTIADHKLVLAMASPVFERMFYGELADKNYPIVIPDIQPDIFQSMLKHIYSDFMVEDIYSMDIALQLYFAAKKYMLKQLLEKCTLFINSNLIPKNASQVYEFAEFYDELGIKQKSLQLIIDRTRKVLAKPSFTDIKNSTPIAILDQDKLNIDNEMD